MDTLKTHVEALTKAIADRDIDATMAHQAAAWSAADAYRTSSGIDEDDDDHPFNARVFGPLSGMIEYVVAPVNWGRLTSDIQEVRRGLDMVEPKMEAAGEGGRRRRRKTRKGKSKKSKRKGTTRRR